MRAFGIALRVIALIAVLIGLLWIGQGLGYIHWPASSFMLDQRPWAMRGACLVIGGVAIGLIGRRLSRSAPGA